MTEPIRPRTLLVILGAVVAVTLVIAVQVQDFTMAQERSDWLEGLPQQHKSKWKVHDTRRPKPEPVTPGDTPGAPPSDAMVLFDGTDLSQWEGEWKVENGYMEVNGTGSIRTKAAFGDCQLHLEYMAPDPPEKSDQARGNSGIIFMGHAGETGAPGAYEVQVLDNYNNPTYPDGYIGAVYGQHPPLVNAGRKPGEWQVYDVVFRRPRFDGDEVTEPGRLTVFLNGVLVQHSAEIYGSVAWRQQARYRPHEDSLPLVLQDHGDGQNPRFRNIWIRRLDLSPEAIDNAKE